jgi:hypothetical protein
VQLLTAFVGGEQQYLPSATKLSASQQEEEEAEAEAKKALELGTVGDGNYRGFEFR